MIQTKTPPSRIISVLVLAFILWGIQANAQSFDKKLKNILFPCTSLTGCECFSEKFDIQRTNHVAKVLDLLSDVYSKNLNIESKTIKEIYLEFDSLYTDCVLFDEKNNQMQLALHPYWVDFYFAFEEAIRFLTLKEMKEESHHIFFLCKAKIKEIRLIYYNHDGEAYENYISSFLNKRIFNEQGANIIVSKSTYTLFLKKYVNRFIDFLYEEVQTFEAKDSNEINYGMFKDWIIIASKSERQNEIKKILTSKRQEFEKLGKLNEYELLLKKFL